MTNLNNKLNKNECDEALTRLLRPYFAKVGVQDVYHSINKGYSIEDDSNLLTLLIMEHFTNSPLEFEELEEKGVYYHIDYGWVKVLSINSCDCLVIVTLNSSGYLSIEFEEDSFFRKQV